MLSFGASFGGFADLVRVHRRNRPIWANKKGPAPVTATSSAGFTGYAGVAGLAGFAGDFFFAIAGFSGLRRRRSHFRSMS